MKTSSFPSGFGLLAGLLALAATGPLAAQPTTFTQADPSNNHWSNGLNWSDGVPTATSNVILPGSEFSSIFGESFAVTDVTIGDGGLLGIAGGYALTITGSSGLSLANGVIVDGYYGAGVLQTSLVFSAGNSNTRVALSPLAGGALTIHQAPGGQHTIEGPINLTGPGQSTLTFLAETLPNQGYSRIEVRDDETANGTINGSLGDGDSLLVEVRGGGTTALYSDSSYQGTTRVLGGITPFGDGFGWTGGLYVLNDASTGGSATGLSTVEVVWNGTDYGILAGDGRIGGDLHQMGGLLLPGNAEHNVGTLTVDGTYTAEYGASYDELGNITGLFVGDFAADIDPLDSEGGGLTDLLLLTQAGAAHSIGGTNLIIFLKSAPTEGQTFRIIEAAPDATITGSFENWVGTGATGTAALWSGSEYETYTFSIIYGANFVDLVSISAIPEPATWAALAGVGALVFAGWRRRRVSRA